MSSHWTVEAILFARIDAERRAVFNCECTEEEHGDRMTAINACWAMATPEYFA